MQSLLVSVNLVHNGPESIDSFADAFMDAFPSVNSKRLARAYLRHTLVPLGVVEINSNAVGATSIGRKFASTASNAEKRRQLASLLKSRIWGVREMVRLLGPGPKSIRWILAEMQADGFPWRSDWQVRYRLNWMRTAGMVERLSERDSTERYPQWRLAKGA